MNSMVLHEVNREIFTHASFIIYEQWPETHKFLLRETEFHSFYALLWTCALKDLSHFQYQPARKRFQCFCQVYSQMLHLFFSPTLHNQADGWADGRAEINLKLDANQ